MSSTLPQPLSTILPKVFPLILDGSGNVRHQALKFLRALPPNATSDHVPELLPYVRAGMTHLAADIRLFSIEILAWSLDLAADEVVSCAGGWVKTLNCFLALLGWHTQESSKWSSSHVSLGKLGANDGKAQARNLQVLADFLRAGFYVPSSVEGQDGKLSSSFPLWHTESHIVPKKCNPYAYLNLFGPPKDDEVNMLGDRDDRITIFNERFMSTVSQGLASARKDGGEIGRAAGLVTKALKDAETG